MVGMVCMFGKSGVYVLPLGCVCMASRVCMYGRYGVYVL